MELWQLIISICAGLITILTLFDKLGLTKRMQKVDCDFTKLKELPDQVGILSGHVQNLMALQTAQNQALLALLRNDLYRCFRDNRDVGAWTDDECRVQTLMHTAYSALNGNGEEAIWWEKKKNWRIVTESEYAVLALKKT